MLAERGVIVSHEAVRYWGRKFGQGYANHLRRRRPRPGDTWFVDAVFLTINSTRHSLWRVVEQDDNVSQTPCRPNVQLLQMHWCKISHWLYLLSVRRLV